MIPKKIHYFWFGKGQKSTLEQECISRFSEFAPGAEIVEWTEDNFDVDAHPYTKQAYADKKWAFVSDYARLKVLYEEGGIYLDTDMYLVQDISKLFLEGSFIGKEDEDYISAGIIGSVPRDPFIGDCLKKYDSLEERVPIPKVLTDVYNSSNKAYELEVFSPDIFYPFNQVTIKHFDKKNTPQNALAVHMWNYSWGNPLVKFTKKMGMYFYAKKISQKIGLKDILKKILRME